MQKSIIVIYRQQYFQVMESLPGELTRRFDQKGFCLTSKIGAVILNSCIGQAYPIPDEVSNLYSKDLNLERLHAGTTIHASRSCEV